MRTLMRGMFALAAGVVIAGGTRGEGFLIRDRDRVVIYGDSITAGVEYQGYPRYLEAYVRTRHPEWRTKIWNRGVSGDTASNLDRFRRDCLSLKPDVILFNMGMNDAGYRPEIAAGLRRFAAAITDMVALARETNPKARIVLISPILYENRASGALPFYPVVLSRYAAEERELARRLGLSFIDLTREYGQTLGLADHLFPSSMLFSADGIHPATAGGHLFMAVHILRGLGAESDLAFVHVDAKKWKIAVATGARAGGVKDEGGVVTFDRTLAALPFPVVETANGVTYRDRAVAFLVGVADEINRDVLKVTGLSAPAYELRIDDRVIAPLSAGELADGVNLSRFFQTPDQDQAAAVSEAVGRKQIVQARLWRLEGAAEPSLAARAAIEKELNGAVAAVRESARPVTRRFSLVPLDRKIDRYQREEQLLRVEGPATLACGDDRLVASDIRVAVSNLSLLPRRVELLWVGAGELPAAQVVEFGAAEGKEFTFSLAVKDGAPAPRLRLRHQPVDLSFPPLAQEYAPTLIRRLDVPRAAGPIAIDGKPEAWARAAELDFENSFAPPVLARRQGAGDFSAMAYLLWDDRQLGVRIRVRDQDHVNHFTDDRFAWDDAVKVRVGSESYTVALSDAGPAILPANAPAGGVRFAVRRDGLETRYELAIPWTALGGKPPEAGDLLPFDITIGDRDWDESHKTVNWCGSTARPQPGRIRLRGNDG